MILDPAPGHAIWSLFGIADSPAPAFPRRRGDAGSREALGDRALIARYAELARIADLYVLPCMVAAGDPPQHDDESVDVVTIAHERGGWIATERWTSNGLKPYFNDFIVHQGHAFGFDGSILACIDLEDGGRTWKGGRYGHGQLVLLADQDLLLVLFRLSLAGR